MKDYYYGLAMFLLGGIYGIVETILFFMEFGGLLRWVIVPSIVLILYLSINRYFPPSTFRGGFKHRKRVKQ